MSKRWAFPIDEGIAVREDKGTYTDAIMIEDEYTAEEFKKTYKQAPPHSDCIEEDVWETWINYLETPQAKKELYQRTLLLAKNQLRTIQYLKKHKDKETLKRIMGIED